MRRRSEMAKDIRAITASADMAAVIDRGADVDVELKNLQVEDKGLKAKITACLSEEMAEGEGGIRAKGTKAAVVVSTSEKMEVDASSERFPELQEAVHGGFLTNVVTCKQSLVVPPADLQRAADALREAGIGASIVESMAVKAADVRVMRESEVASTEEHNARQALESCLVSKVSHRVKYERI
jgi:hypothetical protein